MRKYLTFLTLKSGRSSLWLVTCRYNITTHVNDIVSHFFQLQEKDETDLQTLLDSAEFEFRFSYGVVRPGSLIAFRRNQRWSEALQSTFLWYVPSLLPRPHGKRYGLVISCFCICQFWLGNHISSKKYFLVLVHATTPMTLACTRTCMSSGFQATTYKARKFHNYLLLLLLLLFIIRPM